MSAAVRFSKYGGADVLRLVDVEDAGVGPGEVKVAVVAAGLNPGEIGIREGVQAHRFPATFPEGQGSDFAGLVAAVGPGVKGFCVGDAVIGFSDSRNAQAEFAVVPADRLLPKPDRLDWRQAGTIYVAGTTAWASVDAVDVSEGDTVVVAGAAGGVGVVAVQLAVQRGANVIAVASVAHHDYLRGLLADPVEYGDGLAGRIREAAPDGVDAFIDAHGNGYVDLAVELGVEPRRINTVIDFEAAKRVGARAEGQASVEARPVLRQLVDLLARRLLEIPIYAAYPLREVRDAYKKVAEGHGLGKVVLDVRTISCTATLAREVA